MHAKTRALVREQVAIDIQAHVLGQANHDFFSSDASCLHLRVQLACAEKNVVWEEGVISIFQLDLNHLLVRSLDDVADWCIRVIHLISSKVIERHHGQWKSLRGGRVPLDVVLIVTWEVCFVAFHRAMMQVRVESKSLHFLLEVMLCDLLDLAVLQ